VRGHLTLVRSDFTLQMSTQTIQRALGLSLRHATHQGAAHEPADGAEWSVELVAVVKTSSAVLGFQEVLGAGVRARRSAPFPDGALVRVALDELPVNVQAHAPHVDALVHHVADM